MKKILITGAGSGLGAELAKCYGKDKNHIILVGRTLAKLETVGELVNQLGGTSECISCDITKVESVENLVDIISTKHKNIGFLINNAGVGYFGPIEELTIEEMNTMIDLNVKGTIIMTKYLLPYINEKVMNIISTAGKIGKVKESMYCASKFAVRGFTEGLQKEFAGKNIKITAVYMGGMNTPFWDNSTLVKDRTRLKSPKAVAEEIKENDDGRAEINVTE